MLSASLPSDARILRDRAAAILWVKSQMAKHSVSFDDLSAADCFARITNRGKDFEMPVRYKDAQGHVWEGVGPLPDWLQRAINAGQTAEHFKVPSSA